jgi:hypothetical protein
MVILMAGSQALAAQELLTDQQLDQISAGTGGDGASLSISGADVTTHSDYTSAQNDLNFGSPSAENVVNTPTVDINNSVDVSQNVNSKNEKVILKDYTQQYTKAVQVQNIVGGQVAGAVNAHLTGLRPDVASGSSLNNLYQTNIINQNHN